MSERFKNYFITGGAGFIGSRLALSILKNHPKSKIWIFDNLLAQVHGLDATFPEFPSQVTCINGDVCNAQALSLAIQEAEPEIVFHLAAETGTGQSYDEVTRYCAVNVLGTSHLIDAIRRVNTVRKVVLAASRAVYGEGGYKDGDGNRFTGTARTAEMMALGKFEVQAPSDRREPISPIPSNSTLQAAPASIYASSKLMQELLLDQAGQSSSWKSVNLRFQNVYGPGQSLRNPYTGVLSIFSQQLLVGNELNIYEDGLISRDFVYVDDVVEALRLAALVDAPHAMTIDIGTGSAVSILSVAKKLMAELDCENRTLKITGDFRVGDIRHACADIGLAKEILGWEPRTNIDLGLKKLADWVKTEFPKISSH
jgi:dTDP-L-rhamnose 4-epimerase